VSRDEQLKNLELLFNLFYISIFVKNEKMKLNSFFKQMTIVCLVLLVSCSRDSDTSNPLVLVKRINTVGNESENIEFVYQNNNLIKGISGNNYIEFAYDGNKVITAKNYANNILTRTNTFAYSGEVLTSITSDGSDAQRTIYSYTNNKLSLIEREYLSGTEWIFLEKEEILFDTNSNISQLETIFNAGNQVFTTKKENSFDNKNNPLRDVNPYIRLIIDFINIDELSKNNIVSYDYFSPSNSTTSVNYAYEIIYNENEFPTEMKRFSPDGNLLSTTTIEYQ
jgi:hypothetical protein